MSFFFHSYIFWCSSSRLLAISQTESGVFWLLCFCSSTFYTKILPNLKCPCQKSLISAYIPDSLIKRRAFSPRLTSLNFPCIIIVLLFCTYHNLTYYSYLYIGLFFNILQEICRHLGCKHYILVIFVSSFFLSPKTTTIPWLNICFWFKSGQGAY